MTTPDPKGMARRLRTALADRDIAVSHSEALELVAQQLGARDWNTLAAAPPGPPAPEDHVVPVLRIFDEAAALDFYVGYLDFRVDWRNDTGGHEPLYAQLSRGDARIHLSGHHGDASPGSGVLVPVADAIELQLSLEAKEYAYASGTNRSLPRTAASPAPSRPRRRSCCTCGWRAGRTRPSTCSRSGSGSGGRPRRTPPAR